MYAGVPIAPGEVASAPVGVRVVDEATLQSLYIYQEGNDRVVPKGGQAFFHAAGNYDVGFQRDVTDEVTWKSSNEAVASFTTPGVLTAHAVGLTLISAELDGQESEPAIAIEVYETSTLEYCDPGDGVSAQPTITGDGRLFVMSNRGVLYAFDLEY